MEHFLQSLINKKLDQTILHIGTNVRMCQLECLSNKLPTRSWHVKKIKAHGIKYAFSFITLRGDEL